MGAPVRLFPNNIMSENGNALAVDGDVPWMSVPRLIYAVNCYDTEEAQIYVFR